MTLEEFTKKYTGQKVDYDGQYGYQCVDLFRQYCKDVLNIPHTGAVVGAKELYTHYDKMPLEQKYFERLPYPGSIPQAGDVVVFSSSARNKYGHVAIVLDAGYRVITVLEQDGLRQNGVHVGTWDYTRVLGYLRKKEGV